MSGSKAGKKDEKRGASKVLHPAQFPQRKKHKAMHLVHRHGHMGREEAEHAAQKAAHDVRQAVRGSR